MKFAGSAAVLMNCARQVRTGLAQTASTGRGAHRTSTNRAGMAGAVSRWLARWTRGGLTSPGWGERLARRFGPSAGK